MKKNEINKKLMKSKRDKKGNNTDEHNLKVLEVVLNNFGTDKQKENYKNISESDMKMLKTIMKTSTEPMQSIIKAFFGFE